jgi:hypothetical protein
MTRPDRSHTPTEQELVSLADGSLPTAQRARVEQVVAASPQLRAIVAAQRRVLSTVHNLSAGEPAPAALRARLALAQPPARRAPRRRPSARMAPGRRAPGRRPPAAQHAARAFKGAAVTLAAVAVIAVFMVGERAAGVPSVADAAVLATRTPQASIPEPRDGSVTLPHLSADGLPYPYWEDSFGYKARGFRRDQLAGRSATTVYYARAGHQIAYSIFSGPPIRAGASTHVMTRNGTLLRDFTTKGRLFVTWLRRGHTCVLTSTRTPLSWLIRLASSKTHPGSPLTEESDRSGDPD